VSWSRFGGVVVRTTWDYSTSEPRAAQFRAWLHRLTRAGVRVWNHPRIQAWNLSKRYLQELHEVAGIPVIPTVHVAPGGGGVPDLRAVMAEHGWRNLIIKPCISAGSRASIRVWGADSESVAAGQRFLADLLTVGYDTTSHASAASAARAAGHLAPDIPGSPPQLSARLPLHHLVSSRKMRNPDVAEQVASAAAAAAAAAEAAAVVGVSPAAGRTPVATGQGGSSTLLWIGVADTAVEDDGDTDGADFDADGSGGAVGSSPLPLSSRVARLNLPLPGQLMAPCEMMVQPFISSVESAGELSVIVVDGVITHAIVKRPAGGDFRTQGEYGGRNTVVALSAGEVAMVRRVLEAITSIVTRYQLPLTPVTPGQAAQVLPAAMPGDALLFARLDFLRLTPEVRADFGAGASGTVPRSATASDPRSESESPIARLPGAEADDSGLLLLEAEVIEPCLYLAESGGRAATALADAIAHRAAAL